MINNKKICFISCVNDDRQYEECLLYIRNLNIPDGYEISNLALKESNSICYGYNKGMNHINAKYKVYLHQDTFIINKNFIFDMLNIFEYDTRIGMIGMVGSKTMPSNGIWWESSDLYGQVYENLSFQSR